jgi:hypothetical protein
MSVCAPMTAHAHSTPVTASMGSRCHLMTAGLLRWMSRAWHVSQHSSSPRAGLGSTAGTEGGVLGGAALWWLGSGRLGDGAAVGRSPCSGALQHVFDSNQVRRAGSCTSARHTGLVRRPVAGCAGNSPLLLGLVHHTNFITVSDFNYGRTCSVGLHDSIELSTKAQDEGVKTVACGLFRHLRRE